MSPGVRAVVAFIGGVLFAIVALEKSDTGLMGAASALFFIAATNAELARKR